MKYIAEYSVFGGLPFLQLAMCPLGIVSAFHSVCVRGCLSSLPHNRTHCPSEAVWLKWLRVNHCLSKQRQCWRTRLCQNMMPDSHFVRRPHVLASWGCTVMITAQIGHFPCVPHALKHVQCKGLVHVETEGGGGWMFSCFSEAGSSRTDWDMIQKERERHGLSHMKLLLKHPQVSARPWALPSWALDKFTGPYRGEPCSTMSTRSSEFSASLCREIVPRGLRPTMKRERKWCVSIPGQGPR